MDRNMRSSYINSGPRSLPHMGGSKRHNGHNARLSPPGHNHPMNNHHNHNNNNNPQEDLINYVYDSWNKVTRDLERSNSEAKYFREVVTPRQLANFRPFNLEEWWARRLLQSLNHNKHRS